MTLLVRDAEAGEVGTACALWRRAEQARTGRAGSEDDMRRFDEAIRGALTKPGARLLVGITDGSVVATIYGVPLRRNPTTAQVAMLATEPSRWGSGIGTQMLEALTGELRRYGCRQLRMNVDPTNSRARALYERHGWRHDGETEQVDDSDVPELVYRIEITVNGGERQDATD